MYIFLAGEGAPGWREDRWWAHIDRRLVSFHHSSRLGTFDKILPAWILNHRQPKEIQHGFLPRR